MNNAIQDVNISARELCTSKEGDKCKANYGAPCVYQCIAKRPEPTFMYSWSCDRETI